MTMEASCISLQNTGRDMQEEGEALVLEGCWAVWQKVEKSCVMEYVQEA